MKTQKHLLSLIGELLTVMFFFISLLFSPYTLAQLTEEPAQKAMPPGNDIHEYWTPERLKKAKPLPLPTAPSEPCGPTTHRQETPEDAVSAGSDAGEPDVPTIPDPHHRLFTPDTNRD